MNNPQHHIPEEVLVDYAAGSCPEAISLLVATHLTLCPLCRAQSAGLEQVGAHLLTTEPPAGLAAGALEAMLARLDDAGPPAERPVVQTPALAELRTPGDSILPWPIQKYLQEGQPKWRFLVPGCQFVALPVAWNGVPARLLKLKAGFEVPFHSHDGYEFTQLLSGGLTDCGEYYQRGDVVTRTPKHRHDQLVDSDQDCVCLVINEARLKPLTTAGRIFQALTGL